jgi:predicted metal-binding protein
MKGEEMVYIPMLEYMGMKSALQLIHRLMHQDKMAEAQLVACISCAAIDMSDGKVPKEDVEKLEKELSEAMADAIVTNAIERMRRKPE